MKTNRFLEFVNSLDFVVEAILFDLDGVLLDSENLYQWFWEEIAIKYKKDPREFPFIIKGMCVDDIVIAHIPKQERKIVKQKFIEYQLNKHYKLFDGVIDVLTSCKQHNIKTAIVTSSNLSKLIVVNNQFPIFEKLIDATITCEEVQNAKPLPECWLKAANKIDTDISKCVVFEDSINGLKSALASGCGYVVGLTTTHNKKDVLPLCNYCINNISDII